MAGFRGFRNVPKDTREWGRWFAEQDIEAGLGNPPSDGMVLASTADGERYWANSGTSSSGGYWSINEVQTGFFTPTQDGGIVDRSLMQFNLGDFQWEDAYNIDLADGARLRVYSPLGSEYGQLIHDGTDMNLRHDPGTVNFNIEDVAAVNFDDGTDLTWNDITFVDQTAAVTTGDQYYTSVQLLAIMTGANEGTSYTSEDQNALAATFNGTAMTVTGVTDPFGNSDGVLVCDGNGDYVTFPDNAAFDQPDSTDWCLEGWVRFNSLLTYVSTPLYMEIVGHGNSAGATMGIMHYADSFSNNRMRIESDNGYQEGFTLQRTTLATNTWYHFTMSREGNNWYFGFNGHREFSCSGCFLDPQATSSGTFNLGSCYGADSTATNMLDGWLSNVRLTIGQNRYDLANNSTYTVPTAAFETSGWTDPVIRFGNASYYTDLAGTAVRSESPFIAESTSNLQGAVDIDSTLNVDGVSTFNSEVQFTPQAAPSHSEGMLWYDSTDKALVVYNDETEIELHLGEDSAFRCRNTTGGTISKGEVVYISGAQGANLPLVSKAQADALATSRVAGIAMHDIENNSNGYILTQGIIEGLNTSAYTGGDVLFLSTATPGAFTATRPTTGWAVVVGYVTIANISTGEIKVALGETAQRSDLTSASQDENITGQWDFQADVNFLDGASLYIYDATNTDYVRLVEDGTKASLATNNNPIYYRPATGYNYFFTSGQTNHIALYDAGGTDYLDLSHDGTYLNYQVVNTTAMRFIGAPMWLLGGQYFRIYDSLNTDYVTMDHNGTNFQFTAANTDYLDFIGVTNDVRIRDGAGLIVFDATDSFYGRFTHDGTNFNTAFATTTNWDIITLGGNVRIRDGAGLSLYDSGDTDYGNFTHDGTNFLLTMGNTTQFLLNGASSMGLLAGMDLLIFDASNTDYASFAHDGTDFNTAFTTTTDWNVSGFSTLVMSSNATTSGDNILELNSRFAFRGDGVFNWGASGDYGQLTWDTGKAIVGSQGSNSLVLHAGNGVVRVDDGETFRVYDATGTDYLELGHDGSNVNFTSSNTTAWTFDDSHVYIQGGYGLYIMDSLNTDWALMYHNGSSFFTTFTNTSAWNVQGAEVNFLGGSTVRIQDGALFAIYNSADTDYAVFNHDGTDFITSFVNTTDWDITQLGSGFNIRDGAVLRVYDSGDTDYLALYHDGTDARINSINTTALRLMVENTSKLEITSGTVGALSGIEYRAYDATNSDYVLIEHDGSDAVINASGTSDVRFETGISRSVVFEGQTIDHWHDHAEGSGGDAIRHLVYPRGGFLSLNSSNQSGAILITLPNTAPIGNMHNMVVRGYDYTSTNGAWAIAIGGYDYLATNTWINVSVDVIEGNPPFDVVYFQKDSVTTQLYIQLGDVTDTNNLQYPKIWIEADSVSFSGQSDAELADGWSIALSTAIGNRTNVQTRALLSHYASGANHYTFDAGGEVDYIYWNNIGTAFVLHDGADLFVYDTTDTDYLALAETGSQAQVISNNNDIFLRPGNTPTVRITTSGRLRVQDVATGNDYGSFRHDGTDFWMDFGNSTDFNIDSGQTLTGQVKIFTDTHFVSGAQVQIRDAANTDTATFYHDGTDFWTVFANTSDWHVSSLNYFFLRDGAQLWLLDSTDSDAAKLYHNGTDFVMDFAGTADWDVINMTGNLNLRDGCDLVIYDPGDTDYMEFYHDGTNFNMVGTNTGQIIVDTPFNAGAASRSISASANTVAQDYGRIIRMTSGSSQTFTLDSDPPTNAWVLLDNSSGNSWTIAAGTTLIWAYDGSTGNRTLADDGMAVAVHRGSGTWIINGGGLT